MEDLLNIVVPALVAGFVVLAAGAYAFDKLPESATPASADGDLAQSPPGPTIPDAGGVAQNGTAAPSAGS